MPNHGVLSPKFKHKESRARESCDWRGFSKCNQMAKGQKRPPWKMITSLMYPSFMLAIQLMAWQTTLLSWVSQESFSFSCFSFSFRSIASRPIFFDCTFTFYLWMNYYCHCSKKKRKEKKKKEKYVVEWAQSGLISNTQMWRIVEVLSWISKRNHTNYIRKLK